MVCSPALKPADSISSDVPAPAVPTGADDRCQSGRGDAPAEVEQAAAQLLALAQTLDQLDLDGVRPASP
jgi:hypothetical protein